MAEQHDMYSMTAGRGNTLFLGYATVPVQRIHTTYSPEDAMREGTLFPDLNLPMGIYGKEGFRP